MSSRSFLYAALSFVLGAVAAHYLIPVRPKPLVSWVVTVGTSTNPNDSAIVTPADLQMSHRDVVQWQAYANRRVSIEFEKEIFKNMVLDKVTKRYAIGCPPSDYCDSNALLPTAEMNVPYKYWQALADPNAPGSPQWSDGRIIIVRP